MIKNLFSQDFNDILNDLDKSKFSHENFNSKGSVKIYSKGTSIEHQTQVKSCIDYIYQGEIFQANLSRLWRFKVDEELTDIDIYRKLREKNPAPFSGIVRYKKSSIISSSLKD